MSNIGLAEKDCIKALGITDQSLKINVAQFCRYRRLYSVLKLECYLELMKEQFNKISTQSPDRNNGVLNKLLLDIPIDCK